jgi:hypothetical protein
MEKEFFPTHIAIRRDDLKALGYNADALTDSQMQTVAGRMAQAYLEHMFWWDLRLVAWHLHLPRLTSSKQTNVK